MTRRRSWSLALAEAVTRFAAGRSDTEMGKIIGCGPRNFANARQGFKPPGHYWHKWPKELLFGFRYLRTAVKPSDQEVKS